MEDESPDEENEGEDLVNLSRSTQEVYLEACKSNNIVPSSKFLKQCVAKDIELNHSGVGDSGSRAISVALKGCLNVTTLNLHDNDIGDKGIT